MKVAKTNAVVQRPVSRFYKIEGKEDDVNSHILKKTIQIRTQTIVKTPVIYQKGKPQ